MILHRRHVLSLLAATPLAACSRADLPDPIAAWRSPGAGEKDPRRFALAHAILAPNPHNMQPWLVDLVGADALVLSVDPTRLLPATDPPNRQIVIGCGAFLELLDIAAREIGQRTEITLWPEGEPQPRLDQRPVARVRLVPSPAIAKDPLFGLITQRRTNREPYDLARIPTAAALDAVAAIGAAPGLTIAHTQDAARTAQLRDMVWRGWQREMKTPAPLNESVDVMRLGKEEIARHRDGIAIDFPLLPVLQATGMMSRDALRDPASQANAQGAAQWRKMADTAPAFLWQQGADNSRATQIAAGRSYARLNLAATARGLAMHPWSMALQEYAEMAELYAEQQSMLGATAARPVQMLVRIGYAKAVAPAPRRGLEEHIRT
jgi:hypothetical protein